ncbi:hypothetical protein SUGI_0456590 [Cryptomeria japonica]|nr:hypothetical protein SUGI_0456590 [Cryptomeria japonica]
MTLVFSQILDIEREGYTSIIEQDCSPDEVQNLERTILENFSQNSNPNTVAIQSDLQLGFLKRGHSER